MRLSAVITVNNHHIGAGSKTGTDHIRNPAVVRSRKRQTMHRVARSRKFRSRHKFAEQRMQMFCEFNVILRRKILRLIHPAERVDKSAVMFRIRFRKTQRIVKTRNKLDRAAFPVPETPSCLEPRCGYAAHPSAEVRQDCP